MKKTFFDFYYASEAEQFSFYRIPKVLFTDDRFSNLSAEAKLLYGILLERMCLSRKNNWFDEESRVYIYFTLPASPVSEIGAKKIYTPAQLAGTRENPQTHSFEIYIGGGGVGRIEFCQKLEGRITINGDMYEDDFSGAD